MILLRKRNRREFYTYLVPVEEEMGEKMNLAVEKQLPKCDLYKEITEDRW